MYKQNYGLQLQCRKWQALGHLEFVTDCSTLIKILPPFHQYYYHISLRSKQYPISFSSPKIDVLLSICCPKSTKLSFRWNNHAKLGYPGNILIKVEQSVTNSNRCLVTNLWRWNNTKSKNTLGRILLHQSGRYESSI
jgi:hypothetical protein